MARYVLFRSGPRTWLRSDVARVRHRYTRRASSLSSFVIQRWRRARADRHRRSRSAIGVETRATSFFRVEARARVLVADYIRRYLLVPRPHLDVIEGLQNRSPSSSLVHQSTESMYAVFAFDP